MPVATPPPGRAGQIPEHARPEQVRDRSGQLPLDLRDTRLPWLDAQEADELRRGGQARSLTIALSLVFVLMLAGGAAWYWHWQHRSAVIVADGEIIRAPRGPYKVRPANPGGDIAAGTGDTRFLVAEGKSHAVHVGGVDSAPSADPSAAAGDAGIGVQVGAYGAGVDAEAAWPALAARFPVLSGLRHRVVEQQADMGSVFALQAVTADARAGQALCRDLKAAGVNCMVRR